MTNNNENFDQFLHGPFETRIGFSTAGANLDPLIQIPDIQVGVVFVSLNQIEKHIG